MPREQITFNWWPFYEAYSGELAGLVIGQYEHYRNRYSRRMAKRFPKAVCQEYKVDRKRYPDAVWIELVKNCFDYGIDPTTAISWINQHSEYRMPWPDILGRSIKSKLSDIERKRIGTPGIPYLDKLVGMATDDERKTFITSRGRTAALTEAEELAHRLLLGEFERIITDRTHTAAGLYGLLEKTRRASVEKHLHAQLMVLQGQLSAQV